MRISRRFFFAALASLAAFGPLGASHSEAQKPADGIKVYAASSLTNAMNELGKAYAAKGHPAPVFVYASSSALAKQIEQGAPADFFISADEPWMDYLAERKLIDPKTRQSPLSNKLVLVAPKNMPISLKIGPNMDLAGALHGGKLAMGDPNSVPAGMYGKSALQYLGVWSRVEGSVVGAENVRAALRFVESGEAAAGIVYLTDQMADKDKVVIVGEFPEASHPHIAYPMAAVTGGNAAEAAKFEAFLKTQEAKAVFGRLGFILQ